MKKIIIILASEGATEQIADIQNTSAQENAILDIIERDRSILETDKEMADWYESYKAEHGITEEGKDEETENEEENEEEDENERIYSIISVEKNKLEIVFKELIELIHAKYIEIDLDETDRIAISNYKKLKF